MNYNDSAHQQEGSVTTVVPGGEAAGIENPLRSPSIAEASAPPPVYDAAVVVAPTITAVAAAPAAAAEDQGTRPAQPGDLVIPALAIEAQPDSKVTPHDDVSTEPPSANQLDESGGVATPGTMDVLCGRGAFVNARLGNKKFRALCFSRKPEFDVGNLAAKRRISSEIVHVAMTDWGSRFLRRSKDKGPWTEMTAEQAMLKASQVMRDYKRPDRVAQRESIASASGKKKKKHLDSATPMEDVVVPDGPLQPIVENPFGVHDHDVLCGRGAFVNGHIGNQRLRDLAIERKAQFDRGSYTEKRGLATEVVTIIRSLNPPGRFLQRASAPSDPPAEGATSITKGPQQDGSTWEELSDEKAIHKACQVMRDIDRPDRKHREERKKLRKLAKEQKMAAHLARQESKSAGAVPVGTTVSVTPGREFEAVSKSVEDAVASAVNQVEMTLESTKEDFQGGPLGSNPGHGDQVDDMDNVSRTNGEQKQEPNTITLTIEL